MTPEPELIIHVQHGSFANTQAVTLPCSSNGAEVEYTISAEGYEPAERELKNKQEVEAFLVNEEGQYITQMIIDSEEMPLDG